MWFSMKDNRGSITVEMSFIMPIVIGIVMMLISIILMGLNEGASLGTSQVIVYEYDELRQENHSSHRWEQLEEKVVLDYMVGDIYVKNNEVVATVSSQDSGGRYSVSGRGCKKEWDKCTDRLRRWQLYGDVLHE